MKRNVLVMMTVMVAVAMQAQVEHRMGVQVGWNEEIYRLNEPAVSGTDKNKLTTVQPLYGGRLGFVYELSHESGIGLYSAFSYAYGWNKSKWVSIPYVISGTSWKDAKYASYIEYSYRMRQHVLELCAQAQYKFEIADQTFVGLYTGPTFQYIAQYDAQDYFRYNNNEDQIRYYADRPYTYSKEIIAPYFRDWNITWGVGLAFQFDRYYIRGGYEFGLVNPYKVTTFGEITVDYNGVPYPVFEKTDGSHNPDNRLTRGRLDSWNITLGVYFWSSED